MKKKLLFIGIVLASIMQYELTYSQEGDSVNNNSEWNQWRGPNRDGISLEKNIYKNWPVKGPKILWRISVGDGYSGISVSNNKLFTMWDKGKSQYLVCLDAQTGKELWRYRVDENYVSSWGDGPLATPIVDQNIVYAVSTNGFLHAVNIETGNVIWSQNLSKEYDFKLPVYGYSVSPMIENEKLFIEIGGKKNFAFAALNKNTGELLWHSQTDEPAYSSPIAITINNRCQIVFMSVKGLYSLSPEDGSLLWDYDWESRCPSTGMALNSISPFFIAPDKIFISSAFGDVSGGDLIQVIEKEKKFATRTLWHSDEMNNSLHSSVYFENHIYGFDKKILKCIDATSGKVKWATDGFKNGSLIVADGYLIVLGENGKLALVETNPDKYTEVVKAQILSGRCWTSPTLANGKLYLRNQKEMLCLSIKAE